MDRDKIEETLQLVRERAKQLRAYPAACNEQTTKSNLINPVLELTGWRVDDFRQVALEYKVMPSDNPVDYALLDDNGNPVVLVEAKPLGQNLDDVKWINNFTSHADSNRAAWCLLTNGQRWKL